LKQNRDIIVIGPTIYKPRTFPSPALGYIGAFLHSKGYKAKLIDSNYSDQDPYQVLKNAKGSIVGISCESKNAEEALDLAGYAKTRGNIVVMGGLHVSLIKERILENSYVDYGVYGDGELSFYNLIQSLEGCFPLCEVPGLIFRKGADVVVNAKYHVADLDDLVFPDYRLMGINKIINYPLITSRDCPYECNYCTVGSISHGKWRARSPENIVSELKLAKERYGIKTFTVFDENFSHDIERVKVFCYRLLKENLILPWGIMEGVRADKMDRELLILLKAAGCNSLIYGIESADEAVFKNVSKGVRLTDIERAIQLAKSVNMQVGGYFVVGLPGSTFASEMKSIRFALKHRLKPTTFWMAIPYYNTGLYKWVLNNARLLREPVGENLVCDSNTAPFYETTIFPEDQVKKAFDLGQQYSDLLSGEKKLPKIKELM
jgi:anaerobic magnesium-protoporphyrin IX monomethyl ester cyclase